MAVIEKDVMDGLYFRHQRDDEPEIEILDVNHCHDNYEILFVVSGEGRYLLEGAPFAILPGSLMFIKPFKYHSVSLTQGQAYERYVINFSKKALTKEVAELLDSFFSGDDSGGRIYTSSTFYETLIPLFARFSTARSLSGNERELYFKLLISELVLMLTVLKSERFENNEEELGARVIKYLNENITKELSLDHIAKRFFVSKYYLCRAFKNHNGISIHGYINQKRVMYAKQLIDSGESASAAAYKVGFGDYSSFYRAYLKIIGKAPSQSKR